MKDIIIVLPGKIRDFRISIPAHHLGEILSPRVLNAPATFESLLLDAFLHPIGCQPLAELAQPCKTILIIVDDNTRTTPVHRVIPILLAHLIEGGCQPENVTFALALGTHRRMTAAEIEMKLGREVALRFPVINDPAQQADAFMATGQFFNDIPVEVHGAVLKSDLVLAIGSVVPHTEAGWSGGCKMVLPGMCSERTVMANHRLAASAPGNMLGQDVTPVRQNMEEIVAGIGLDFSLNLVVTPGGQIVGAFGGHFVSAQRAAVRTARQVFSVPYDHKADVVIANAYPADVDFWQASKGIWAGELLVKPGGTVILHAECPEGMGPHPNFLEFMQRNPARLAGDLADRAMDQTAVGLALPVARMLEHMQLVIVSPGLAAEAFGDGPIRRLESLAEAVEVSLGRAGGDGRISVLTHGGYTYPVLSEGSPGDDL